MKLKHVGMIVVSVLAMSSAAVSAAEGDESVTTTVNGGVIHFKGEVVNAACAIDSESMNQTVELGQVRSSRLAKAGDLSSAVGFNIKLNDCDTNFWRIMKLKHVGMIVVSVLAMSSAAVSAAEGDESVTTTVNGGVIHFKGEVVNAACAIDSESMNQTVELGQVRSSRLAKAGDLSSAVGFNIKLNDCDTNVSSNAAVAFLGTTVTSNDDTLALQSSAAGSAQNVGIQILDRTGEVLILDGATFSAKTDLIDGTNILPFQARYIALGQSVAGTANADATFKVQYL